MIDEAWFVVPARRDSKGLPAKNQMLLHHTINMVPIEYHKNVIVTTNDNVIIGKVKSKYPNCHIHNRSESSAIDTASTKECLEEVIRDFSLKSDIIMLYLTYPERTWHDIVRSYTWYKQKQATSLLCKLPLVEHPYLCMRSASGDKGEQIITHDLYRRQDYPPCFRISHMISIFNALELPSLNGNLYNKNTVYYSIAEALDVDTVEDLRKIEENI